MNYLETDLGYQQAGAVVEVTLRGNAANVFLVDSSNHTAYRQGGRYTYYGGQATRSPVRLTVPRYGHWYMIVDLGGYAGHVEASARVLAAY